MTSPASPNSTSGGLQGSSSQFSSALSMQGESSDSSSCGTVRWRSQDSTTSLASCSWRKSLVARTRWSGGALSGCRSRARARLRRVTSLRDAFNGRFSKAYASATSCGGGGPSQSSSADVDRTRAFTPSNRGRFAAGRSGCRLCTNAAADPLAGASSATALAKTSWRSGLGHFLSCPPRHSSSGGSSVGKPLRRISNNSS
mmetsp:Transcript_38456/g.85958  ORF Transcript_38456/g.85958 Transcript_38456/m.85958 type:complete len:200 (-) Transcript_38456:155-754(-)